MLQFNKHIYTVYQHQGDRNNYYHIKLLDCINIIETFGGEIIFHLGIISSKLTRVGLKDPTKSIDNQKRVQ